MVIPAIVQYTSSWYKRSKYQLRAAWLFSFSALAGAFAGLLAARILNLVGVHGIRGWKWIFIIEGVKTREDSCPSPTDASTWHGIRQQWKSNSPTS